MIKVFSFFIAIFFVGFVKAQNVGIGTTNPKAPFNVAEGKTVLFGFDTTGEGSKFIWYPSKYALRAGFVDVYKNYTWNYDYVGFGSFAAGTNNLAAGESSFTAGVNNMVKGGGGSIALGSGNSTNSPFSTAFGTDNKVNADTAFSIGYRNLSEGPQSTSMGANSRASGRGSFAAGNYASARSAYETTLGSWNTDYSPSSSSNWNNNDRLFTIGNGTGTFTKSDAVVILKNGNMGIGNSIPTEKLEVTGKIKTSSLQITSGAANGNVLMSDINGNASWKILALPFNYWNASGSNIYNNNAGNVGIGTSSPNAPLQFETSNQKRKIVLFETANNDNQFFGFGVFAGELRYQTGVNTDDHVFYTAASAGSSAELMRIKGNGNVGIGTAAPTSKLQVDGAIRIQGNQTTHSQGLSLEWNSNVGSGASYLLNNKGLGGGGFILGEVDNANNITHRLDIDQNGNIGIGNAAPASKLDVNGALATKATYYGIGGGNVALDNNATVWIFAINGFSVSLPDPTACANRRYTIVNKTNAAMTCSIFYNMENSVATSIPAYSSIEVLASINTNRWEQIR